MNTIINLKTAVVVPVYDESPELVLNLLLSLANQTKIDKKNITVFFAVNNSKSEALKKSAAFLLNRKVIALLEHLAKKTKAPKNLPKNEKLKYKKIIESEIKIQILDLSSLTNAPRIRSVGLARNKGGWAAHEYLSENGVLQKGIIVFTDCDCEFSKNAIFEIQKTFYINNAKAVFGRVLPISILKNEDPILKFLQEKFFPAAKIDKSINQPAAKISHSPFAFKGGCNLAIRAEIFKKTGGIRHLKSGEDLHFMLKLLQHPGEIFFNSNYFVKTYVRSSIRAGHISFGSRIYEAKKAIENFLTGKSNKIMLLDVSVLDDYLLEASKLFKKDIFLERELLELGANYGMQIPGNFFEKKKIFKKLHKQGKFREIELYLWQELHKYCPRFDATDHFAGILNRKVDKKKEWCFNIDMDMRN